MAYSNPKYCCLFVIQLLLLGMDLCLNSLSLLLSSFSPVILSVVYALQDFFLVLSFILTFLIFFNTFTFTSGLITILLKKFSWSLCTGVAYLLVTIAYQIWSLNNRWNNHWVWSGGLQFMYVLHKMVALFYYYIYKRGLYRLSDPKLYLPNSSWVSDRISTRVTVAAIT
ncbi:PREDICTED: transmembrane protein 138-like [Amphimedon queenslandica]|uniref:Transmembrane protein 138 n=1 Tax=Amphimedon queenslandica TaxID=400682 RepID=A0A1X7SY86_AMPQE|nr:PREDICTED: transmembrane protein 138-like [Amphimedon queenslandica]|eukprot:XP_011408582.1 PREDICTED: transmembrane protein 138-like [Amphimedon queenslandica]